MNILAFDASGRQVGVAVASKGKVIFSHESTGVDGRKEDLHAELSSALKTAKMKFSKLDAIAVGLGPGSFTGLRIALAAAKVLAWSSGVKLYGFSTLEAIAASLPESQSKIILDASRGNVYTAHYSGRPGRSWRVIQKPHLEKKLENQLTPLVSPALIAAALAELVLCGCSLKPADPFRLEPLYIYPKDCNATLPR